MCPDLDAFEMGPKPIQLGLAGDHQRSNAALALQLARTWLARQGYLGKGLDSSVLVVIIDFPRDGFVISADPTLQRLAP